MPKPCSARRTNGEECHKGAILGGTVCATHGGSAPQVRRAAQERLAALVDPAITRLTQLIDQTSDPSVAMRAVADLLDRAGFKPTDKLKLSGDADEPLEIVISRPAPAVVPASDESGT